MFSQNFRLVHGSLRCQLGVATVNANISAWVLVDSTLECWIAALQARAHDLLIAFGAEGGTVYLRHDGTNEPLSLIESIQDWCYRNTIYGKQITGGYWVDVTATVPQTPTQLP